MTLGELIKQGETAVAVMTRGDYLVIDDSRSSGRTGIWVVDRTRVENTNKVVVYLRSGGRNTVLLGDVTDVVRDTTSPERFWIHFNNLINKGETSFNWSEFAETGSRPVRYWPPT
jgi:hypothetical protein